MEQYEINTIVMRIDVVDALKTFNVSPQSSNPLTHKIGQITNCLYDIEVLAWLHYTHLCRKHDNESIIICFDGYRHVECVLKM